jgi:asparagine synthetase B (glutamine-hydrolysing)
MTRLAIIDLVTGRQPMSDETGRYWVVFNGESTTSASSAPSS